MGGTKSAEELAKAAGVDVPNRCTVERYDCNNWWLNQRNRRHYVNWMHKIKVAAFLLTFCIYFIGLTGAHDHWTDPLTWSIGVPEGRIKESAWLGMLFRRLWAFLFHLTPLQDDAKRGHAVVAVLIPYFQTPVKNLFSTKVVLVPLSVVTTCLLVVGTNYANRCGSFCLLNMQIGRGLPASSVRL